MLRIIATYAGSGVHAKVYRDSEWNEYRVKFYRYNQHLTEADYHTPDKLDAIHTACAWTTKGR